MSERRNVELNLTEDFSLRHGREFAKRPEAGIVYQHVDFDFFALQLVEQKLGSRSCGEIQSKGFHSDSELAL